MTDITNYTADEQYKVIRSVLKECTAEIRDEQDNVSVQSIFTDAVGYDTESTTITTKYPDITTKTGKVIKGRTLIKDCFNYCYQVAIGTQHYALFRYMYQFLNFYELLIKAVNDYNSEHGTNAVLIVWCANLSHEWSFIKRRFVERFAITKMFAKSERDALYIQTGNVEMRECIGLFGHSLDDIGKNWSITQKLKDEYDYSLIRHSETVLTDEEKKYCINDVIVLTEMHQAVIQAYKQENGCIKLPLTSSGFVRQKLKESIRNDEHLSDIRTGFNERATSEKNEVKSNIAMIKKFHRYMIDSEYQWYICRHYSYSGGLCGSNIDYVGQTLKDVVCADVTSDYPAQFMHQKYPSGKIHHADGKDFEMYKHKHFFAVLHITEMKSKSHHATFSKHKIVNLKHQSFEEFGEPKDVIEFNGKIWCGKNLIVVWNDIDLKAYSEIYDIKFKVLEMWYFDRSFKIDKWLTEPMMKDYFYKSKLKAENKHKSPEYKQLYDDSKRDVNSYYGVCAQKEMDVLDELDADLNFTASAKMKFSKARWQHYLNPYWAFYCTSYARALLMHFISRYPDAIVQYDTDSLYYIKSKGAELEKELLQYNEKIYAKNEKIFKKYPEPKYYRDLGTWDFDEIYTRFLPLGAKKYIKEDVKGIHTVIAGLPKLAVPREIADKKLKPFEHYNPVRKFIETRDSKIIVEHMYAHKFASVYCDSPTKTFTQVTDNNGKTINQECDTYHAILPIDFTLDVSYQFLMQAIERQRKL